MADYVLRPCLGLEIRWVLLLCLSSLLHLGECAPTVCFEKISNFAGLYLQEHPRGGAAVVANQAGLMQLVTLPAVGSPAASAVISTWLDLTGRVVYDPPRHGERGLLSFAFHPKFASNGRFFVSYTCDSTVHPDCKGTCGCNAADGCIPGWQGASCTSHTIVAEYWAGPNPLSANSLRTQEVRKILRFARPFVYHNGGHIFFGKDGYLYYASGDGGNEGDPFNLAQQGHTLYGKMLRLDVDNIPDGQGFSVPPSNPFLRNSRVHPSVYALGLRNPWRCDQDPVTGVILCGDVGGDQAEEIDMILPGHNYQWHNKEGTLPYTTAPLGRYMATQEQQGIQMGPLVEYAHGCGEHPGIGQCLVDNPGIAIIGGVFYRGPLNRCLQGRYLYSDLFGPMFLLNLKPLRSLRVQYRCAPQSPLPCGGGDGSFGLIYSWASDRSRNAYVMASQGIYRVTDMRRCRIRC